MHPLYDEFVSYLDDEDKEKCVQFVLSNLQNHALDIVTLYNEILTPALYADFCKEEEKEICIWKEHIRTSIVRTIIECCYPFIVKALIMVVYGVACLGPDLSVEFVPQNCRSRHNKPKHGNNATHKGRIYHLSFSGPLPGIEGGGNPPSAGY